MRIDDTAINGLRRRMAPTLDGMSNVDHGSVGTQVNNISVDAILGVQTRIEPLQRRVRLPGRAGRQRRDQARNLPSFTAPSSNSSVTTL